MSGTEYLKKSKTKGCDSVARKDGECGKEKAKEKKKCKSCGKDVADQERKKCSRDRAMKHGENSEKKFNQKKSNGSNEKGNNGEGDHDDWSHKQVSKLKDMKGSNKSWKEIASEVEHQQGECKSKWKELQSGTDAGNQGRNRDNDPNGTVPGSWAGTWNEKGGTEGGESSFADLFMDGPTEESDKQDNNHKSWNTPNQNYNEGKKQRCNGSGNDGNGCSPCTREKQHRAGQEGWSYKTNQASQQREQTQGRLRANDVWSKDDCEVLEVLEAQHREHKWLHIQAGFFNWTGRMIAADLIEGKFIEDDDA